MFYIYINNKIEFTAEKIKMYIESIKKNEIIVT